jgi:hypothetical protein
MADRTNNRAPRLKPAFWRGELRESLRNGRKSRSLWAPSLSVPVQMLSTLNSQLSTFWRGELRRVLVILSLLACLIGCGNPLPVAFRDFSETNTVGVILGEVEREYDHGLQHLYHEKDGFTQPATVRNQSCRSLNLTNFNPGYFYFKIDPTFKKRKLGKVKIEVEYFDDGEGEFGLQYDAANSPKDLRKAYTYSRESVALTLSRSWQTHAFEVTDATFKNNQNSGADFRVYVSPPELCVRSVTVTQVR